MHFPARDAARAADSGRVDVSKRVGRTYESGDNVSSSEWTAKPNPQVFSTTSAATERVRFWTTKNQWRRFFRLTGSVAKDTEHAAKEINRIAGELLVRISRLLPRVLRPGADAWGPIS